MARNTEIYVSTDIEADGPIPGPSSMLSIGSAAYAADRTLLATFSANLETLPGATPDPRAMEWWATQPQAWAACRKFPEQPDVAMRRYVNWLKSLPGKPVFVGYPAGYDFLFVYWYLMRFAGESPFSFSALDIKTYAMAMLKTGFRQATKRNMPRRWFEQHAHTHVALNDAIEQGALFCNMLAENRGSTVQGEPVSPLHEWLERIVRNDTRLMELLKVAREADLPQWRVVAGCIYQTVWNSLTGRAAGTGINDYDLIYFDKTNLSQEAEAATEDRVRRALPDFPRPVEVCNQARVHLWFEDYFGVPYPPLSSADEAITRYASATHAVGVRLTRDDRLEVFAPFGLDDIFNMVITPNYSLPNKATHERKAARVQAIWTELKVEPWLE